MVFFSVVKNKRYAYFIYQFIKRFMVVYKIAVNISKPLHIGCNRNVGSDFSNKCSGSGRVVAFICCGSLHINLIAVTSLNETFNVASEINVSQLY